MTFSEEGQLLQHIKSGELAPVYLLYGEEKYLQGLYCQRLIKAAVGDTFLEFNLHQFEGNRMEIDQLLEACEAMPFMSEKRCVVVKDFPFSSLAGKDKEKLEAFLSEPVETTVLVLLVEDEDFLPKKNSKAKKWLSLVDKSGIVMELGKRKPADMVRFLQKRAQQQGCSLSRELCYYLMERCENDMLTLANEVEKTAAFAGSGEITKEQIDAVTIKAVSAKVYDLSRAILADQYEKALSIVEELLYLRYQPTVILSALSGAYVDLYIAKTAKNGGKGQKEILENFEYKGRDFVVRNSLRDCGKYSLDVLRSSIDHLAQMDYRMKSSRADSAVLLEQAVTQLFFITTQ